MLRYRARSSSSTARQQGRSLGHVLPRSIEGHSIVVHGFTHQQEMKSRGDTLIVNPGESCGWVYGTPKAAILDLDAKKVEFLSLDPAHWTT